MRFSSRHWGGLWQGQMYLSIIEREANCWLNETSFLMNGARFEAGSSFILCKPGDRYFVAVAIENGAFSTS